MYTYIPDNQCKYTYIWSLISIHKNRTTCIHIQLSIKSLVFERKISLKKKIFTFFNFLPALQMLFILQTFFFYHKGKFIMFITFYFIFYNKCHVTNKSRVINVLSPLQGRDLDTFFDLK